MRFLLAIALAVAAGGPATVAHAAPKHAAKGPTLSPADRKQYKERLKQARALEAKRDYAGAITVLEGCLKIAPDDPTALGELGFALFKADQLDQAEAMTRKALRGQASPSVRGATLFNLGMIREARSDKPGAVAAYSDSLAARPNATVRARLAALDAGAAAQLDPYAPAPLAPFASIKAFCEARHEADEAEEDNTCSCGDEVDAPAMKLAAPYRRATIFTRHCFYDISEGKEDHTGTFYYYVGVTTGTGLFAGKLDELQYDRGCEETLTFEDARSQADKLLVKIKVDGGCVDRNSDSESEWQRTGVAIIGGTKPAMTPPLFLKRHETSSEDRKRTVNVDLSMSWGKDGSLEVKGKTTGLDKAEAARLLGKHTLAFP